MTMRYHEKNTMRSPVTKNIDRAKKMHSIDNLHIFAALFDSIKSAYDQQFVEQRR